MGDNAATRSRRPGRPRAFDEEKAVDLALDVFWRRGFEEAGTEELLDVMGIKRSSLYNTFGDKRNLFIRSLERYFTVTMAPLLTILDSELAPPERIDRFLVDWVTASKSLERRCLFARTLVDPPDEELAGLVADHRNRIADAVERTITEGITSGQLSSDINPAATAHAVLTIGVALSAVADREDEDRLVDSIRLLVAGFTRENRT